MTFHRRVPVVVVLQERGTLGLLASLTVIVRPSYVNVGRYCSSSSPYASRGAIVITSKYYRKVNCQG
jgi:hypothetical protein